MQGENNSRYCTSKNNFVDVIDTGTTTHCFLKESNVDNIRKVDLRIIVMSPNRGVTQYIATAEVKLPHVSKKARDAHMSSVVKPKQLKVKTTLDIVPQKTNYVDVIVTGTTKHCFLKESNVEKIRNVNIGINVMSPNGGVTQSIATAKVKLPHVSKKARDAHMSSVVNLNS